MFRLSSREICSVTWTRFPATARLIVWTSRPISSGTVEIWFEDTYEWHPPYTGYGCPEKKPRGTHFGHAALVQMKTRGAQDFQMRGKATFPMKIFPAL